MRGDVVAAHNEGPSARTDLIGHPGEALQFLIAPDEQPPGAPYGLRIGTGNTHTHAPALGDDARCAAPSRGL